MPRAKALGNKSATACRLLSVKRMTSLNHTCMGRDMWRDMCQNSIKHGIFKHGIYDI